MPPERRSSPVKARVQATDKKAHLLHCTSLIKQVQIVQRFQGREAEIWSNAIQTLPEAIFKISINAVSDTLPHNKNIFLWETLPSLQYQLCSKEQPLPHILNSCSKALEMRHCSGRLDSVLERINFFLLGHLPPGYSIIADLLGYSYMYIPEHCNH